MQLTVTYFETGSLDNAIQEFSLTQPSWYMSLYTILYKYNKRESNSFGCLCF